MKFILAHLFVLLLCTSNFSQQVSGTIFFTDGTNMNFTKLNWLFGNFDNDQTYGHENSSSVKVYYENALREVSFKKLRMIEVLNWEKAVGPSGQGIKAKINVETTTGIQVEHYCGFLLNLGVKILDKLTGEVKNQNYYFLDKNNARLNIIKIVFNN